MRVHGLRCSKASASYSARAAEPWHIVAGVRFHLKRGAFSASTSVEPGWFTPISHRTQSRGSAEAARMQSGSSARPLCFHSPRQHEREGVRSGRSATEDLVFKLK